MNAENAGSQSEPRLKRAKAISSSRCPVRIANSIAFCTQGCSDSAESKIVCQVLNVNLARFTRAVLFFVMVAGLESNSPACIASEKTSVLLYSDWVVLWMPL